MSDTFNWRGASGSTYTYHIRSLSWIPDPGQDGNYIFAKLVNGYWHAVYVGQGDLRNRRDAAIRDGCVNRKGATHYHVHLNNDVAARRAEESDIIAGNPECVAPVGCNVQT